MEVLLEEPPADQGLDDTAESHGYKVVMAQVGPRFVHYQHGTDQSDGRLRV